MVVGFATKDFTLQEYAKARSAPGSKSTGAPQVVLKGSTQVLKEKGGLIPRKTVRCQVFFD